MMVDSDKQFPDGPLSKVDMVIALMADKDPTDKSMKVTIPEGATANSVIDQLFALGYMPTRVLMSNVFFVKK